MVVNCRRRRSRHYHRRCRSRSCHCRRLLKWNNNVYEVLPASIYITHLRSACGDPARCPHSCTSWLYRCGHLHATTTGARSTCALLAA